ncbi:hypothetical protein HETIRDRAFT_318294 [Heterobasidion irregulare TC 32-1]|uniref:Uncharacterized protein n=1 Tax=Heterobasidion irregulare (strain TC 32-1) TaxID=747525 RepID=W4K8F8_HETIT|nr:uncharacterized protein HETIRDRAFT_318294 [Heterobasidion irregulare TC 32-1]ETW82078.1 hypothetical protein HETIRDRAFT_318294 [Heterobasidion irregulare TC 32-1]
MNATSTRMAKNNKLVHGVDGKVMKEKVWMVDAMFNRHPQSLYFSDGKHPDHAAGVFKGMIRILEEHWYYDV